LAAHLEGAHGTLVCRDTPVEKHWRKYSSLTSFLSDSKDNFLDIKIKSNLLFCTKNDHLIWGDAVNISGILV
jgi:hypothetical protein